MKARGVIATCYLAAWDLPLDDATRAAWAALCVALCLHAVPGEA